jgi:Cu+-exporting ATPase
MAVLIDRELVHAADAQSARPKQAACFHCGEACRDGDFRADEKQFCCHGCLTVYEVLVAGGLGHFYDLNRHPGIRVAKPAQMRKWDFLDEPEVVRQLVDFSDEKITRVTLRIPAIHCIACVWLLENLFQLHPAIGRCTVNFPRREAAITFSTGKLRLSELVTLLCDIGYEPQLTLSELGETAPRNSGRKRQWLQIGVAGFAFGNIMLFSLPHYLGTDTFSGPIYEAIFCWLSLAFALPAVTYSASDYWKSAWLAARRRTLTLDVPIALGLVAIYGQSLYEIVRGIGPGYCDSLTGLIFFLLCGRMFQQATYDRIAFDRDYKSFFPLSVARKTSAGEETVSLSSVRVGDRLVLRNGELIPADARLASSSAMLDYSFVTGESEPVKKSEGDYLYAGGQQIGPTIEIKTLKPVSQSYLTSLWNDEAFKKEREDHLNTLTNRYSRRFTRIVLAVAIGAALFWVLSNNSARGIKAFTSVLIVACPCALALAAPFALGTAQRLLGRLQVFLKNALVIERMAAIDTIVFDKTGTLTTRAAGVRFEASGNELDATEEIFAYSLARHSTHPHAARISETLGERHFPENVVSFAETPGCGIEGLVKGHPIRLGSRAWLEKKGVLVPDLNLPPASLSWLGIDGWCRGAFLLTPEVRPEVQELLRSLRGAQSPKSEARSPKNRYDLALLSGDNERERESFRELFGCDATLHFSQSPMDKLAFIKKLQAAGKRVMMVGDGLNDAGALKQSDVGVAVVERVGAFSPASDIILEAGQVTKIAEILSFARMTARIIRLSFLISALYNLIGIGIAAAGLLSPLVCAILMPLSSASVVLFACGATKWAGLRNSKLEIGFPSPSLNGSPRWTNPFAERGRISNFSS